MESLSGRGYEHVTSFESWFKQRASFDGEFVKVRLYHESRDITGKAGLSVPALAIMSHARIGASTISNFEMRRITAISDRTML
jgi:hypothetical protein